MHQKTWGTWENAEELVAGEDWGLPWAQMPMLGPGGCMVLLETPQSASQRRG